MFTEVREVPSVNSVESILDIGSSSMFDAVSMPKMLGCMSRNGLSHRSSMFDAISGPKMFGCMSRNGLSHWYW